MEPFTVHSGKLAVVPQDHVDTDRIIPARFLSRIERAGYGELLFADVRGPEFPLDSPAAQGATVLVVGTNFGCGSSREHAVWALQQAGFRAVISRISDETPGFSDIFRQNAANCGLLLIELPAADWQPLVDAGTGARVTVDLPAQSVTLGDHVLGFSLDPAIKNQVLKGLDLIGTTLESADAIRRFEDAGRVTLPRAEAS